MARWPSDRGKNNFYLLRGNLFFSLAKKVAGRSAKGELTVRWAARCKRAVEAGVSPAKLKNAAGPAATTPLLFDII
jgi:hypothetical protein